MPKEMQKVEGVCGGFGYYGCVRARWVGLCCGLCSVKNNGSGALYTKNIRDAGE